MKKLPPIPPRLARPDYCPCDGDKPDPCPACGATVEGNDPVGGECQARYDRPDQPPIVFVVTDKRTGEVI